MTIDLRSDTVTRPTAAMRAAMAAAPVGDDQFGEDPTVNALQERVAALLGKEAALWVPSGTMANQIAIRMLTRPGDEVVVSRESHLAWHETGAAAANSGVQFTEIGAERRLLGRRVPRRPQAARPHAASRRRRSWSIENTHNRAGGVVVPQCGQRAVCAAARAHDVATYLDGARLWNAAVATGDIARGAGGAVRRGIGRVLEGPRRAGRFDARGSRDADRDVRLRYRRMFGGAMRQTGIFAAAGLYALDHHMSRLVEDHANARLIADRLAASARTWCSIPTTVKTNIVVFRLAAGAPDARDRRGAGEGGRACWLCAFGPRTVRAVTHLDVTREQCLTAADALLHATG